MDELATIYRKALPAHIAEIERARAEGGDAGHAMVRRIAHTLRGSGATYGFPRVTVAATGVEEARPGELDARVGELLDVLRSLAWDVSENGSESVDVGSTAARAGSAAPQRVLIVDDDAQVRLLVSFLLEREGHVVVEAADADAARAAATAAAPDIVLMDVHLGADDGVALAQLLFDMKTNVRPRVVFLTGAVGTAQVERMDAAGAAGVIRKPFDPEKFVSVLERVLSVQQ